MLYLGVHVGPFVIRVSQLHIGRSSPRLEPRLTSAYDTGRRRAPEYHGCLPNRFSPVTHAFGYEALNHLPDGTQGTLDRAYFRKLMSEPSSEPFKATWRALLATIRESYIHADEQQEPMNLALYLEGISFRGSRSKLRFWESPPDETPRLQEKMSLAGEAEGLASVRVVTASQTIDGLNRMEGTFCQGDLVFAVGAVDCGVWSVESPGLNGTKRVSAHNEGWLAVLAGHEEKADLLEREVLFGIHNPHASRELLVPALGDWQKTMLRIIDDAVRTVESPPVRRLLLAGEAAYLIDATNFRRPELTVEYLRRHHFVYSHGAAAVCFLERESRRNH